MKYIIIALILAVAVGGLVLFVNLKDKAPQSGEKLNSDISTVSTLTVIDNQIQTKALGQDNLETVTDNSKEVSQGTLIKTSATGRGILESENETTTTIDKNSEIVVVQSEPNKSTIKLESGNLWARVQKVFGQGEYYKIETDNAVATVRGTNFGVFYLNKETIIMVVEGSVWAVSVDPITGKPVGQEIVVTQGQKAIIKDGQAPVIEPVSESDKKLEWYVFNHPEATPTPKATISPTPAVSKSPTPTPKITSTPTLSPTATPTPIPTPTPTPQPPSISSVTPKVINLAKGSADLFINGQRIKGVFQVLLNNIGVPFYLIDAQTIGATVTRELQPGVYDVNVKLSTGEDLTLPGALTVVYE